MTRALTSVSLPVFTGAHETWTTLIIRFYNPRLYFFLIFFFFVVDPKPVERHLLAVMSQNCDQYKK